MTTIKARVLLRLPARIIGTGRAQVTLDNGVYTVHVPITAADLSAPARLIGTPEGSNIVGEISIGSGLSMVGDILTALGTAPGGIEGALQYKNGSILNGAANAHWNAANNSLILGSAGVPATATPPLLDILSNTNATARITRFSNDGLGPNLQMAKSRHATFGSHTVLQNNDIMWDLVGNGSTGTEFAFSCAITARVNGTPSGGVVPSDIAFITTNVSLGSVETLKTDFPTTAGQTGLLLWDVDNGTLERVTVGAADSGGAGFKVLRIPN